ncbi:MAG: adenosylcobinamide-GDP ribazoletransferase [Atribacterota bacterium]|jgi:adenosylcobinamide-GDP ribazoletransferase|nr:adenosylcobinamide-GDP ribazoletransferase [Atribacterota bacterium]MDD5637472.1 adenosylcobinamide-GDP ribazoletransferase [Atribacterota bacterium]
MGNIVRRFLLALSFLTVLPVSLPYFRKEFVDQEVIKEDLSKASIFFPLVGLLMGGILFTIYWLLKLIDLPVHLEAGFILAVWVVLSGGLHLEGLADMIDGFFGGQNKENIISIMKDGSIGAKGAIALIILILLKYLLLISLAETVKGVSLLLAPMMGRWAMVLTAYLGKPASSSNTLTKMFTNYLGKKELVVSTLFTVGFNFLILSPSFIYHALVLLIITGCITGSLIAYSNRKIQGICGDVIGAINEISELVVLLVSFLTIK